MLHDSHGTAESLLTVTNLLIVFGLKEARRSYIEAQLNSNPQTSLGPAEMLPSSSSSSSSTALYDFAIPTAGLLVAAASAISLPLSVTFLQQHPEPWNALSIPTWMVHASSLLEWLVAMQLIWDHSLVSGNPRWKGLTIAMIPSHTSGLCACTFHLFYNGG